MTLLNILHEDDEILVVDKPADLVCHPTKDGELSSLIGRVRLHLGDGEGRLVNRLDRETSGVVLIAKGRVVASELGRLFGGNAVKKRYVAVVHGHLPIEPLVIDARLGKDEDSVVAIKDCVRPDGALAETRVWSLSRFERAGRPFTLASVVPRTGRKHQIRIHLAHAGFPIVGDKLYGEDEQYYLRLVTGRLTDADYEALIVRHHALHAAELSCVWRDCDWHWMAPMPERLLELAGAVPPVAAAS